MRDLAVALDVGTRKICAIVAEVRPDDIFVVGVGIEPSEGMKKGIVNDMGQLTAAISAAVHKAEKSSGFDIAPRICQRGRQPYRFDQQPGRGGHQPDSGA